MARVRKVRQSQRQQEQAKKLNSFVPAPRVFPTSNHAIGITGKRHNLPGKNDWLLNMFKGEDVFIVGGGGSLHHFYKQGGFALLEDKNTICLNHSYMYCKTDILLFLDKRFKGEFEGRGHRWADIRKVLAGPSSSMRPHKNISTFMGSNSISHDPGQLYGITMSGLAGINAALLTGAKRIFLMGLDCGFVNGLGHFYSREWQHVRDNDDTAYRRNAKRFDVFKKYSFIYNLSKESRITAFEKLPIDEILCKD